MKVSQKATETVKHGIKNFFWPNGVYIETEQQRLTTDCRVFLFPTGFSLQIYLFHPFFNVSNFFVDVNALKKKGKKNKYYYIYKINIYYTKILFLDIHWG